MYLFINTSEQGKVKIALFNGKGMISSMSKAGTVKLTEKLVFFITQLLKKQTHSTKLGAGNKFKKLKGIVVVTGPGSFTSVRIGCVIANTLAQVLKIGIYGAHADSLNTDQLILKATKKVKKNRYVVPFYDREPNITIPGAL